MLPSDGFAKLTLLVIFPSRCREESPGSKPRHRLHEAALTFLDRYFGVCQTPCLRRLALHNNVEYSVQEELAQSDDTSIPQPDSPLEFFLCTDRCFAILRKNPTTSRCIFAKPTQDDGSLARQLLKQGFQPLASENLEVEFKESAGSKTTSRRSIAPSTATFQPLRWKRIQPFARQRLLP